jgi:putative peptidoglycan lipid II flippase
LGFTPLADAYNLANTLPNMLYDLVLGGVAGAAFIPVFVERLRVETQRRAWKSISSVLTGSLLITVIASAVIWIAAPWIVEGVSSLQQHHTHVSTAQRQVTVSLLRWFVPQVASYAVLSMVGAIVNIHRKFAAIGWAPVANNLICIAVLLTSAAVNPHLSVTKISAGAIELLGLGTTAGVLIQALLVLPALRGTGASRLTLRLDWHDPAWSAVRRLGAWTLGVVVTNQISLLVILATALAMGGQGPVSAYTYGWSFMQMPFAVVVASIMATRTPALAEHAADGDLHAVSSLATDMLRRSLVVIIPLSLFFLVLARPLMAVSLGGGNLTTSSLAGIALSVLAAGLPGFTIFQVAIRTLQSVQRAVDVFILYVVQNALTVAGALVMGRHSFGGLVGSISLAYSVAALLALSTVRYRGVSLTSNLFSPSVRYASTWGLISALMTVVTYDTFSATRGVGLLIRFIVSALSAVGVWGVGFLYWRERSKSEPSPRGNL